MATEKKPFQFNQTPEELEGAVEKPKLPEHISKMDVLADATKEQLAGLEKALGSAVEGSLPAQKAAAEPPPSPPEEARAEMEKDKDREDEPEGYLGFLEEDGDVLLNDELREAIESRCEPLDLQDLVASGRARQVIPIVPGAFEVVFQTTNGEEDLFVKDRLLGMTGSAMSVQQRYADMNLAMGLVSLCGTTPPSAYVGGEISADAFDARVAWLRKLPVPLLASLHINYAWFERRTRKLFSFRGDR